MCCETESRGKSFLSRKFIGSAYILYEAYRDISFG